MTTTDSPTVADYKHPEWCDLTACRPSHRGGLHYSQPANWPTEGGGCDVQVRMLHSDDLHPETGIDASDTVVHLQILGTEVDEAAAAWLTPSEARTIAALLHRYADEVDRANRFPNRYRATELDVDRRAR